MDSPSFQLVKMALQPNRISQMKKIFLGSCTFLLTIAFTLTGYDITDFDMLLQVDCLLKPISRKDHSCDHGKYRLHENFSHPHMPLIEGTSLNWSGYAAATSLTHPAKDSVTAVSGQWRVPALAASSGAAYCAIWTGIDGLSDATVEQIGTEHNGSGRAQQNYAWFEMYPSGAYEIVDFPVNVNDEMGASVIYEGESTFKLTITNYTRGVYFIVPSSYTKSSSALRSSAEWIVEAPSSSTGVLPLADFGTVTLTNCIATINGFTGAINFHDWVNEPLTMETQTGIIKSLPSTLFNNGTEFSLTWRHE
jgi:hypothetical protein